MNANELYIEAVDGSTNNPIEEFQALIQRVPPEQQKRLMSIVSEIITAMDLDREDTIRVE